ncbi:hypothetical protein [Labilibacter marinus]|uniref:hypothetical protein n=1 Tax=Labilibacter marinus TaxID=1477105 RepID=UPI00094F4FB9|nr:hypothetical protein [Labilibacter marinus]
MKLNCIEISINNEELGCQVTFSEKRSLGEKAANMSVQEIIDSTGKYLLIQRSYADYEDENEYVYYETHDGNFAGELVDYEITLSKQCLELDQTEGKIIVSISPTAKEYRELKKTLPLLVNKSGKLIINE